MDWASPIFMSSKEQSNPSMPVSVSIAGTIRGREEYKVVPVGTTSFLKKGTVEIRV